MYIYCAQQKIVMLVVKTETRKAQKVRTLQGEREDRVHIRRRELQYDHAQVWQDSVDSYHIYLPGMKLACYSENGETFPV